MQLFKKLLFVVGVVVMLLKMSHGIPLVEDLQPAATGHDHGRVQIKVYRGPTEHDHHDSHAPWGYWVKQPADDEHH